MIKKLLIILMLCVLLLGAMTLGTGAEANPNDLIGVIDASDLLTDEQEAQINAACAKASEAMSIPVGAYVFSYAGHSVWGDDVLAVRGLDGDEIDLVLMVVEVTHREVFYYLYTYGDAELKINEKELNYILDDNDVYFNFKQNRDLVGGLCAYAALTEQAYNGRLGVSGLVILFVALIIGAVAGALAVAGVKSSYARKNPSVSYPLDRFAQLNLTRNDDHVTGKFVTHTFISTGGRGGRGGGGGGRPGGGGGGGFRGGR